MKRFFRKIFVGVVSGFWWLVGAAQLAVAQNQDWAKPINDKINLLTVGLASLSIGLAVLALVIACMGWVLQQRIEVMKVGAILGAALISTTAAVLVPRLLG